MCIINNNKHPQTLSTEQYNNNKSAHNTGALSTFLICTNIKGVDGGLQRLILMKDRRVCVLDGVMMRAGVYMLMLTDADPLDFAPLLPLTDPLPALALALEETLMLTDADPSLAFPDFAVPS